MSEPLNLVWTSVIIVWEDLCRELGETLELTGKYQQESEYMIS